MPTKQEKIPSQDQITVVRNIIQRECALNRGEATMLLGGLKSNDYFHILEVESDPNKQSTSDMIALDAGCATLTTFQTGQLLAFAMQLLNLPTEATHLLGGLGGVLSGIIGHDPIRAAGRHHNPETLHFMCFGKAFDFELFALLQFSLTPTKAINALIGLFASGVINLTIVFERAVIELLQRFNKQHQLFGRIPSIHQDCSKR